MTVYSFFSYLRNKSVWTLSQNLQIYRFFCKIREEAMEANCLILPVTGYAHVDMLCGVGIAHETMNGNHDMTIQIIDVSDYYQTICSWRRCGISPPLLWPLKAARTVE